VHLRILPFFFVRGSAHPRLPPSALVVLLSEEGPSKGFNLAPRSFYLFSARVCLRNFCRSPCAPWAISCSLLRADAPHSLEFEPLSAPKNSVALFFPFQASPAFGRLKVTPSLYFPPPFPFYISLCHFLDSWDTPCRDRVGHVPFSLFVHSSFNLFSVQGPSLFLIISGGMLGASPFPSCRTSRKGKYSDSTRGQRVQRCKTPTLLDYKESATLPSGGALSLSPPDNVLTYENLDVGFPSPLPTVL